MKGDLLMLPDFSEDFSQKKLTSILDVRTEALKQEVKQEESLDNAFNGVAFLLSGEQFFIESKYITEVTVLPELIALPGVPSFFKGIFNIRGKVLALLDLTAFLSLPETQKPIRPQVIIIRFNEIELGIMTEQILGSFSINKLNIHKNIFGITGGDDDYIQGISEEQRFIVLDIKKILNSEKITINQKE